MKFCGIIGEIFIFFIFEIWSPLQSFLIYVDSFLLTLNFYTDNFGLTKKSGIVIYVGVNIHCRVVFTCVSKIE